MLTNLCVVPTTAQKGTNMSRFKKMSHTIWFCEYHIVWIPKYRYRVLRGKVKEEMEDCIREQNRQMGCEVVELNVQADHVHMVAMVPPKVAISEYMGRLKGKSAIRMFSAFRDLRRGRYGGNHFWAQGYCVGTVGLNEQMIRQNVRWQEKQEQKQEEFRFNR
jgi:REP-associated tyrosine transposase